MEEGMEIEFDAEADAIYVHLLQKPYAHGVDLDDWRRVDYSADNEPIGVELLMVSRGVNVHQLPYSEAIAEFLETKGIMAWRAEQNSSSESGYPVTNFQMWPALLMPTDQHVFQVKEGVTA
jgi:uncharacterized protein YuzE